MPGPKNAKSPGLQALGRSTVMVYGTGGADKVCYTTAGVLWPAEASAPAKRRPFCSLPPPASEPKNKFRHPSALPAIPKRRV